MLNSILTLVIRKTISPSTQSEENGTVSSHESSHGLYNFFASKRNSQNLLHFIQGLQNAGVDVQPTRIRGKSCCTMSARSQKSACWWTMTADIPMLLSPNSAHKILLLFESKGRIIWYHHLFQMNCGNGEAQTYNHRRKPKWNPENMHVKAEISRNYECCTEPNRVLMLRHTEWE